MKKVILGAALCSAAVALAAAANADGYDSEFLYGSTNALVLGPTGVPTPNAAYISDALRLYLDPNGYDGTTATTLALTTPESYQFGSSVAQGEKDLVNGVLAEYNAGDMGCTAAGVCTDPLTIFTYSQSSAVAALAEQQLAADNIPTDALRFVMLGANPTGVPDNLYPTEVYNINGDIYAEPSSVGTTWQTLLLGTEFHDAYMGLTAAEINSATSVVDEMTTVYHIAALTTAELWAALFNASSAT